MRRRLFIDWMRGIAVLCMIEHHTFDAFLHPSLHGSAPDRLFRFLGGVAAPGFLFLAGLAVALLLEDKDDVRRAAWTAARRGLVIFAGAYLFRFQEWALAGGRSPPAEMLRIDILNTIGVALVLVALVRGSVRRPVAAFAVLALVTAFATPIVWAMPLGHVPLLLADYLRGTAPRALFPLFPWLAHAFAGAVVGTLFARARRAEGGRDEPAFMLKLCAATVAIAAATLALDALPVQVLPPHQWWLAAPAYFVLRTCSNVLLLAALWLVERLAQPSRKGTLALLGRHSLVIYWVHIELVYGRWFWRARGTLDLPHGVFALACVLASMVALAQLVDPARKLLAGTRKVQLA